MTTLEAFDQLVKLIKIEDRNRRQALELIAIVYGGLRNSENCQNE